MARKKLIKQQEVIGHVRKGAWILDNMARELFTENICTKQREQPTQRCWSGIMPGSRKSSKTNRAAVELRGGRTVVGDGARDVMWTLHYRALKAIVKIWFLFWGRKPLVDFEQRNVSVLCFSVLINLYIFYNLLGHYCVPHDMYFWIHAFSFLKN